MAVKFLCLIYENFLEDFYKPRVFHVRFIKWQLILSKKNTLGTWTFESILIAKHYCKEKSYSVLSVKNINLHNWPNYQNVES